MFAVEIRQPDNTILSKLVKRQVIKIGSAEDCHVVVPSLNDSSYHLQVEKDLGNSFKVRSLDGEEERESSVYDLNANIDLEDTRIFITSLDYDLVPKEGELAATGSAKFVRLAANRHVSKFPLLSIRGDERFNFSLISDVPVYLGRADNNDLILDFPDISSRHARIGFENGKFWVEDLGSTNGTYVNRQQVSGRVVVEPGDPIVLGLKTTIFGVLNDRQLSDAREMKSEAIAKPTTRKFPVVVATSEIARPARLVMPTSGTIRIGRDPDNEIWLGVPHVSRKHCEINVLDEQQIEVVDCKY